MENKELEKLEIKNNAIIHKDNSLNRLDLSFLKHIELKEYKTSHLLAYWINDFAVYHDKEKEFDYSKSGIFSRWNVVKANLGFNIGNELGGVHYCIVLNKYDNVRNGVLNVIPLTSKKMGKSYPNSTVNLGKELYNILETNIRIENEKLNKVLSSLDEMESVPENVKHSISNEMHYIQKIADEVEKMKKDSIALINQITTISKQRIYNIPVLKKVKLSNNSLDLIDKKIMQYFTK